MTAVEGKEHARDSTDMTLYFVWRHGQLQWNICRPEIASEVVLAWMEKQ